PFAAGNSAESCRFFPKCEGRLEGRQGEMMGLQKPDKGRRGRLPRSKPDFPAPALCADANDMACFGKHVGDAARDCGGWIEPGDRPWGQSIELVKQKRIMGA